MDLQIDPHELERKRNLARRMLVDSGCTDPTDEEIDEVVAGAYRRLMAQQAKVEARANAAMQARMEMNPDDDEDDGGNNYGSEQQQQQQQYGSSSPEGDLHRELDEADRIRAGGATGGGAGGSVGARVSASSTQPGGGGADAHWVNNNNNNIGGLPAFPDFGSRHGNAGHTTTAATASNRRRSPDQAAAHGFQQGMGRAPQTYVAHTNQKQRPSSAANVGKQSLPLHQRRFEPLVGLNKNFQRQAKQQQQQQQQSHPTASSQQQEQQQQQLPQREQEIQRLNRAAVNYTLLGLSSKVFAAVGNKIEHQQQQQQQSSNNGGGGAGGGSASSRSVLKSARGTTRIAGSTLPVHKRTDPVSMGAALREKWGREQETTSRLRKQLAWDVRQSMLM